MIYFCIKNHDYINSVQTGIQIFYPNTNYINVDKISNTGITIESIAHEDFCEAIMYIDGSKKASDSYEVDKTSNKGVKMAVKSAIYMLLSKETGYYPKWGSITGVRPAKTAGELMESGLSEEETVKYFMDKFFVSEEKAKLAVTVSKAEEKILSLNKDGDVSIYIGIPFCPTRCLYCSFTSYPLDRYSKVVDSYLDKLIEEIKFICSLIKGRRIMSVYIGGGTPTALNEIQLERLLKAVNENIDLKEVLEFTVEAGRPDTITFEKLEVMKKYGVERISINPQTMNQKTLDLIGRRHSVEDIKNVYKMARDVGFKDINMDVILALPEETAEDVRYTMEEIKKLAPDSMTVHTLAVKRASRLKEEFENYELTQTKEIEKMISISAKYAEKMGLRPYYMYRQKNMAGNFENVGYCKEGCEGIYNIEIMEEKQTIIAAGAGGTTKVYNKDKNLLVRAFNVKGIEEYMGRFDEMLERKTEALKSEL